MLVLNSYETQQKAEDRPQPPYAWLWLLSLVLCEPDIERSNGNKSSRIWNIEISS